MINVYCKVLKVSAIFHEYSVEWPMAPCIDSFMVNISFKAVFKINFACRF